MLMLMLMLMLWLMLRLHDDDCGMATPAHCASSTQLKNQVDPTDGESSTLNF